MKKSKQNKTKHTTAVVFSIDINTNVLLLLHLQLLPFVWYDSKCAPVPFDLIVSVLVMTGATNPLKGHMILIYND